MNKTTFNVNDDFSYISEITREQLKEKHGQICDELKDLYARKNHDYGTVFEDTMEDYGLIAPVVRMRDKLGRIETLLKVKNEVADESILDTIHDLANYAIMTCSVLRCLNDVKDSHSVKKDLPEQTSKDIVVSNNSSDDNTIVEDGYESLKNLAHIAQFQPKLPDYDSVYDMDDNDGDYGY